MTRTRALFVSTSVAAALWGTSASAELAQRPHAGGQARGLSGSWEYTAPELRIQQGSKTVSCSMTGVRLTLQQRDTMLIGSSRGGVLRCEGMPERPVTDAPVDGGVVRKETVQFRLGPFVHNGTVTRRGVSGTLSIPRQTSSGRFQLTRR